MRTMRALEEESGCLSDRCNDDVSFLRGLVLDGRFTDAEVFIRVFDAPRARFLLRKQHFLELVHANSGGGRDELLVELRAVLKSLEPLCSKAELNELVLCVTHPGTGAYALDDGWTPHVGRLRCFSDVMGVVGPAMAAVGIPADVTPCCDRGQLLRLIAQAAVSRTASPSPSSSSPAAAVVVSPSTSAATSVAFDPRSPLPRNVRVNTVPFPSAEDGDAAPPAATMSMSCHPASLRRELTRSSRPDG